MADARKTFFDKPPTDSAAVPARPRESRKQASARARYDRDRNRQFKYAKGFGFLFGCLARPKGNRKDQSSQGESASEN